MNTVTPQDQLRTLENQMRLLIQIRNERKRTAELQSKKADVEFDQQAIPLARRIKTLREQIEDEKDSPTKREHHAKPTADPDPEWGGDDVEHFRELLRRNGR